MKIDWRQPMSWVGVFFATCALLIAINRIGDYFGLEKSDWAAWVQAIGSIVAIVVAIQVARVQAMDARKIVDETNDVQSFNALVAMSVEISTYARVMVDVKNQFAISNAAANLAIFPETIPDFPIFAGCAAQLGSPVANESRSLIIATYGNIRTTFESLNRCSEAARRYDKISDNGSPLERELDMFHKRIPEKAEVIIRDAERIRKALRLS